MLVVVLLNIFSKVYLIKSDQDKSVLKESGVALQGLVVETSKPVTGVGGIGIYNQGF